MKPKLSHLLLLLAAELAIAVPVHAQSDKGASDDDATIPLTPETLGDALSCRSPEAAVAFASALFLESKPPAWMRETKGGKATKGMIGLYGFRLSRPVSIMGETVERVYFMKDWVVTLWPREKAEAFIAAQKMERAPIRGAEQYYRFIDPENGPMLGAFEPTGGSIAVMLAKAFGAEPPTPPPSGSLFVGCNYTPASREEFLEAARQSEEMLNAAAGDVKEAVASGQLR